MNNKLGIFTMLIISIILIIPCMHLMLILPIKNKMFAAAVAILMLNNIIAGIHLIRKS